MAKNKYLKLVFCRIIYSLLYILLLLAIVFSFILTIKYVDNIIYKTMFVVYQVIAMLSFTVIPIAIIIVNIKGKKRKS